MYYNNLSITKPSAKLRTLLTRTRIYLMLTHANVQTHASSLLHHLNVHLEVLGSPFDQIVPTRGVLGVPGVELHDIPESDEAVNVNRQRLAADHPVDALGARRGSQAARVSAVVSISSSWCPRNAKTH